MEKNYMNQYEVVEWPQSQELMDKKGFKENAFLINDEEGMKRFGSSAYFVNKEWLNSASNWSKIIILDFSCGDVTIANCYDVENVEDWLSSIGFNPENCQWMICDELKLHINL